MIQEQETFCFPGSKASLWRITSHLWCLTQSCALFAVMVCCWTSQSKTTPYLEKPQHATEFCIVTMPWFLLVINGLKLIPTLATGSPNKNSKSMFRAPEKQGHRQKNVGINIVNKFEKTIIFHCFGHRKNLIQPQESLRQAVTKESKRRSKASWRGRKLFL